MSDRLDVRSALTRLAEDRGDSLAALSRMLGRNVAYLQQFVTRGTPLRLAERDRRLLARYFGVDEGMLGGEAGLAEPAAVAVPRFDATPSAGPGTLTDEDRVTGSETFDAATLQQLGVRAADASVVVATGTSMEPTLFAGDRLLVDRSDRRPRDAGGLYVLRGADGLLVKRVRRRRGGLEITSDNPAAAPVAPEGIAIVGRVVQLARALR